jgi:signal transduction histidine kinase
LESYQTRLRAAGVEVAVASRASVIARADREKVRQVLVNLIENALDAMAGRGGRLSIDIGHANGSASVRVTDSGPGLPADALPHLFEPFFSLKPDGTGLGLAIARRTLEAHGGRIEAVPVAGAGLSLRFELPLAPPPAGSP